MTYQRKIMAVLLATAALVACGDDDDDDSSEDTLETLSPDTASATLPGTVPATTAAQPVAAVATDYKFSGIPATAPAGTAFTLQNDSTVEVHEMIMIRIPDSETRPVSELVALPEAEADALFANVMPALVTVALPGEVGTPVLGDGTVSEPGRYAVVCFIPVGADPADRDDGDV